MAINDGGAAYPQHVLNPTAELYGIASNVGMSKLEVYAKAAMEGIIAAYSDNDVPLPKDTDVARWSFEYAAAMLAEHDRRMKEPS